MKRTRSTPIDGSPEDFSGRGRGRIVLADRPKALSRFIDTYAATGNIVAAASAAGVTDDTARHWSRDAKLVAQVFRVRQAQLSSEGGGLAYAVLREIMTERTILADGSPGPYVAPVQERRQAAVAVLRLAGHTEALGAALAQAATATALADLTEEQLREHVRTAEAALAALRATAPAASGGDVLDVTPDPPEVSSLL